MYILVGGHHVYIYIHINTYIWYIIYIPCIYVPYIRIPVCWRVACSCIWSQLKSSTSWKRMENQAPANWWKGDSFLYHFSTICLSTGSFQGSLLWSQSTKAGDLFLKGMGRSKNTEALGFPNRPKTLSESVFPPSLSLPHRHGIRPDSRHARQASQPAGCQAGHHHHLWHHTQGLSLSKKFRVTSWRDLFPALDGIMDWVTQAWIWKVFPANLGEFDSKLDLQPNFRLVLESRQSLKFGQQFKSNESVFNGHWYGIDHQFMRNLINPSKPKREQNQSLGLVF